MIDRLSAAAGRDVSRETYEKLRNYVKLLEEASQTQNLISAATLGDIWERHVLDSAQLARLEPLPGTSWVDIGSGAGLPGIVLACIVDGPVTLVEPRRLRSEFLADTVQALGLTATVVAEKAEKLNRTFDVITGRAVANLSNFLGLCEHLSTRNTTWVLPKGRNAQSELAEAQRAWHGVFHVEPSMTDVDSRIIVATDVRARKR